MAGKAESSAFTLTYNRFTANIELEKPDPVSLFPAATIRGGFGITLRSLVCTTKEALCENCLLRRNCVYTFLFESFPAETAPRLKKYKNIPRPFALQPRQKDNSLTLDILLFGKAIRHIPYFIYTLNTLGKKGLGKNRTGFKLINVTLDNRLIYPVSGDELDMNFSPGLLTISPGAAGNGTVSLHFVTPFVIRKENEIKDSIDGRTFIASLLRRVTNLNAFYEQEPAVKIDPTPYLSAAETLELSQNLFTVRRSRFSTRQKQRIAYSGFTGAITIKGDIGTLIPLLRAGEVTGVGKNTAFGYGRYRMECG